MASWMLKAASLVMSVVILAACSRGIPAPVEFRTPASGQPAANAPTEDESDRARVAAPAVQGTLAVPGRHALPKIAPGTYVVKPGDSLFSISQRSDVVLRDLIETNALRPPYELRANDTLKIPAVRYHEVAAGDTVTRIVEQHGVSMRALILANGMQPPYLIRIGQRLRLPSPPEEAEAEVEVATAPRERPAPSVRPPQPSPTAQSTSGDRPPLPAHRRGTETTVAYAAPAPSVIPQPPRRAGQRFAWPVQGRLISRFGPKLGGFFNDGINIAVSSGTPVRAAENGVVTYVGNELRGFGNLLLLRHQGGWVTAYAHAEDITVKPGDIVRRGQVIARVGRSGRVQDPQLHFEIRKGRKAVDPLRHLPKQRLSAQGPRPEALAIPGAG